MKKLALNVNDLRVESFQLNAAEAERGTVNGHASDAVCTGLQCTGMPRSCVFTCEASCETHICSC